MELILGLLSGVAGGNAIGKAVQKLDQGTLINSAAGVIGGGLGATLLGGMGATAAADGGMSVNTIVSQVLGGGAGGGIVLSLVSIVKNMMSK